MTACEKCWSDAHGDADRYRELVIKRYLSPCTPEEQAGPDATVCSGCGRKTVHQHAKVCMACMVELS